MMVVELYLTSQPASQPETQRCFCEQNMMMMVVKLYLTSLFLTGSTTSGLTIPSKAPSSPVLSRMVIMVRVVPSRPTQVHINFDGQLIKRGVKGNLEKRQTL